MKGRRITEARRNRKVSIIPTLSTLHARGYMLASVSLLLCIAELHLFHRGVHRFLHGFKVSTGFPPGTCQNVAAIGLHPAASLTALHRARRLEVCLLADSCTFDSQDERSIDNCGDD